MKKNKLISLSVAAITTAVLLSGVTYAWFVNKANVTPVDVSTGKIAITGIKLKSGITNKLPGDKILMNDTPVKITQAGTREAIVEVSFKESLSAKLGAGMVPTVTFATDYDTTTKEFKAARLAQVASLTMEQTPGASTFVEVNGKYYARLEQPLNSTVTLGNVFLNIDGELGGNKGPAPNSPDRSFEMTAIFSATYDATAVQVTKEAISDVFGADVATAVDAAGMIH